jgi:hypothetical protein
MAKVPGFAKAFAGRWRIAAEFSGKGTTRMTPPAVADQASFAHAAEFFNSLLGHAHIWCDGLTRVRSGGFQNRESM